MGRFQNKILTLVLSVILAGCGSSSQDFPSEVEAKGNLEKISFSIPSPVRIKGGEPVLVSWPFKSKQPSVLSVHLSSDSGVTWTMVEPFLANTGIYNLNAPLLNGATFKLKITNSTDTEPIAVSDTFEIDSLGPVLNPLVFASPLAISQNEFVTHAIKIEDVGPDTWTLDLTALASDPADFRTFVLVNASQRGGEIICSAKICVYKIPETVYNTDTFSIYLEDLVGNITGPILVSMNPNYVPATTGGGSGGGGSPTTPTAPFTPPTLIPLASINDGGLGATDPASYCPKTSVDGSLTPVVRICRPGDNWAGCTHKAASLDLPQSFFAGLAAGTRVEIVYDTSTSEVNNTWRACDFPIATNNMTVVGVCGRPVLSGAACQMHTNPNRIQKALLINTADNTRIVNLEFKNMYVSSNNGSGIRNRGKNLVVSHSYFHDGQQGILGDPNAEGGFMLIQKSKFQKLGALGYEHTIYASSTLSHLVIKNSVFARTRKGHELKSRAQQTTVQCSAFTSRASTNVASFDSTSSYLANFPQGGKVLIEDSVFSDGMNSENSHLMSFADEAADAAKRNYHHDLTFRNNKIMAHNSNAIFLMYRQFDLSDSTQATSLNIANNIFAGLGATYSKPKFFNRLSGVDLSSDLGVSNTIAASAAAEFPTRDSFEDMPMPTPAVCTEFSFSTFPNN